MAFVPQPAESLVVFYLVPLNDRAKQVAYHPRNAHLVTNDGQGRLKIGRSQSTIGDGVTLATLGRCGDVFIDGTSVARVQCAFEMDPVSRVVMLYDRSHNNSTGVHAVDSIDIKPNIIVPKVFPFQHGRSRKVYVGPLVNPVLGMCGVNRNVIKFRLAWLKDSSAALSRLAQHLDMAGLANVPHLAKTIDDTETAPEMTRVTRIHTPALGQTMLIRYLAGEVIGEGAFGVVHRVINVDTGRVMALKRLKRSAATTIMWATYQREVKILTELEHPHILDLIWSQRWDHEEAEIFCGLKDGALDTLIRSGSYAATISLPHLASRVLHHMLQALDALASRGIIHRDVKPENIFYVNRGGAYQFQLGDFGLSNHAHIATSGQVGTAIYMAPEMYSGQGLRTTKVDVWSLFVTMLWVLDIGSFRLQCKQFDSYWRIQTTVQQLAANEKMAPIRPMVAMLPEQRASAAQMLCACFDGEGLTTPRNQVPAMHFSSTPAPVPALTPVPTAPPPRFRLLSPPVHQPMPIPNRKPADRNAGLATGATPPPGLGLKTQSPHPASGLFTGNAAAGPTGANNRVQKWRRDLRPRQDQNDVRRQAIMYQAATAQKAPSGPSVADPLPGVPPETGSGELTRHTPGAFPEF